jgi:hypothetical protein
MAVGFLKFVSRETIELKSLIQLFDTAQEFFLLCKQILVFKFILNHIVSRETINKK